MNKFLLTASLLASLAISGCSSTSSLPKSERSPSSAKVKPECCIKKESAPKAAAVKKQKEPSLLAKMQEEAARLVKVYYFDFDSHSVKNDDLKDVASNTDFMNKYPGVTVRMTGHADDRGSAEYNVALGQRRAAAVENLFKATGVNKARVESISLGEEKPLATGNSEAAYSKNRRVELEYFIVQ